MRVHDIVTASSWHRHGIVTASWDFTSGIKTVNILAISISCVWIINNTFKKVPQSFGFFIPLQDCCLFFFCGAKSTNLLCEKKKKKKKKTQSIAITSKSYSGLKMRRQVHELLSKLTVCRRVLFEWPRVPASETARAATFNPSVVCAAPR